MNEPNPHPAAQTGVRLIALPPAEPCRRSPVRGPSSSMPVETNIIIFEVNLNLTILNVTRFDINLT